MNAAVSGSARLRCRVTSEGDLADCIVVQETPPDYGFGAAALALVPHFHLHKAAFGPNASIEIPLSFNVR